MRKEERRKPKRVGAVDIPAAARERPGREGAPPLHAASSSGDVAQVRSQVAAGAPHAPFGAMRATPLHLAIKNAPGATLLETVQALQESKGCDVRARDAKKLTPLHLTIGRVGDPPGVALEVAQALLGDEKCDAGARCAGSRTPLHCAVLAASEEGDATKRAELKAIVALLLGSPRCNPNGFISEDRCRADTPLLLAVAGGDVEVVEILLKKGGVDPDLGGEEGTPLYSAVSGENHEIAKLLLDAGADVNKGKNERLPDMTPLTGVAASFLQGGSRPRRGGFGETLRLLLGRGGEIGEKYRKGDRSEESLLAFLCLLS